MPPSPTCSAASQVCLISAGPGHVGTRVGLCVPHHRITTPRSHCALAVLLPCSGGGGGGGGGGAGKGQHVHGTYMRFPPPSRVPNTEGEARLRQQQELYEAVRTERNNNSRSLVEVQVGASLLRLVWQRQVAVLPGRSGGRAPAHACAAERVMVQ